MNDFAKILLFRDSQGLNLLRLVAAIGCAVFLTVVLLCSDPWSLLGFGPEDQDDLFDGSSDKVYHLIGYFGLSISMLWYGLKKSRRVFIGLAMVAAAHAVLVEWLQQFVPPRTTDLLDLYADFAGLACGCGLAVVLRRLALNAGPNSAGTGSVDADSARADFFTSATDSETSAATPSA